MGLGAARSATFGLSDVLGQKIGGEDYQKSASELEKRNPIASGVGTALGIGGALLAPEAGVFDALNPVKAVSKVGQTVTEMAAPTAERAASILANPETSPIANAVLKKAAPYALGSAAEGAFYGAGQSVSEDALGDPDAFGQKLMANIGLSSLIGGGLGGLIKAGETAIPEVILKAKNAIGNVAGLGTSGEPAGPLWKTFAKASSFVSGKPEDTILDAASRGMNPMLSPEEKLSATEEMTNGLQDHFSKVDSALKQANKDIRPEEINKILSDAPVDLGYGQISKTINDLGDTIKTMRSEPDLYPKSYSRVLELVKDRAEREAVSVLEKGSASDAFNLLNDMKSRLDEEISYGATPGPGDQRAENLISKLRRSIKDGLEDTNTWGEAGARQAAFNDAQKQYLNMVTKGKSFNKAFMEKVNTPSGRVAYRVSPSKIKTFLSQTGNIVGDTKGQLLDQYLNVSKNLVDQIDKTYSSLPGKVFDKEALKQVIDKQQAFNENLIARSQQDKLMNFLGGGGHNAPLAEGAAGALIFTHHPAAAAALESAALLKNPGLAIQRYAKMQRLANKVTNSIISGSRAIFKSTESAQRDAIASLSAHVASYTDPKKYKNISEKLNKLSSDPEAMMDHASESTMDVAHVAPNTAGSIQQTSMRAIDFLSSKLPKPLNQRALSPQYMPSKAEMATFGRYMSVVDSPTSVLKQVKTATITPESIETLVNVYPKLYQEMQSQVMSDLMEHQGKLKTLPYKQKMSISMFLGQDLMDSLDQENIASNQMLLAKMNLQNPVNQMNQSMGKPSKGTEKLTKSSRFLTDSQASSQRERA